MISDEMDAALDRLQQRLEKGVPALTEASAKDLPLIFKAAILLRKDNLRLAECGLRLSAMVEDRAHHDALAMGLGPERDPDKGA